MATVTATITVDFTANYAGTHRVCWRIQGSGDPYDCSTTVNCVGGGTACQAMFDVSVNTTSCDGTITFEGYVQAACQDVLSTSGRVAWTQDFVPSPTCLRYEILCARGGVDSVTVDNKGQEYLVGDTLTLVQDGADPEAGGGAISITAVGDGVINTVSGILTSGSGYTALDVITVNDAGGSGAGATIRIDTVGGGGEAATFTVTANGTDYVGPFTFTGGTGTGVSFTITEGVDYDRFGSIQGVTVGSPGLYGVIPTVTITTGTGSGAVLTAVLEDCPAYNSIGTDCDSNTVNLAGLPFGDTWATCIEGAIAAEPSDYDVTQTGCCIPEDSDNDTCYDYHIENLSGGNENVQYTSCDGIDSIVSATNGNTTSVCAVIDGVLDPQVSGLTITTSSVTCTS